MAVRGKTVSQPDLKHIAEEVYKQNAELALKNRVLSLLHDLYKITASTLEQEALILALTQSIAKGLHLPFVAILGAEQSTRGMHCAAMSSETGKRQLCDTPVSLKTLKPLHPIRVAKKLRKKRQAGSFEKIVSQFISVEDIQQIQSSRPVVTTSIVPLVVGRRVLGILLLGLDEPVRALGRFEKESMVNVANVVSIALDRARAYEDVKAANDQLKELDELKTEFLSIASHQLRTPLSIIKGYVSLLAENAYGEMSDEAQQVLTNIDVSNERLVKLVDEFLNISRIEQGRTRYSFDNIDLVPLFEEVITELQEKANRRGIKITAAFPSTPVLVVCDEEKVRHAIYNYIDNAIKYSHEQGVVTVSVEGDKKKVLVTVQDSGVGLDDKDIENLFQKFYRSPHVVRDVQGTGLGLYVVRQFVEAHGGTVQVVSDGIDKGSRFSFTLPTKPTTKMYKDFLKKKA